MKRDYSTITNKLDNKKLYPIISSVRKSYWKNYNTALSTKENFMIWGHDVQKMSFPRLGEIFGIKRSQAQNVYHKAKGGRS